MANKAYLEQIVEIGAKVPRAELRPLLASSNLRGFSALATTYGIITACFIAVKLRPSLITIVLAFVLIGGRQLALAILSHEAAHKTLFASKSINEWVGKWLCGYPLGNDLVKYRTEHLQHHQKTGTAGDPDRGLVAPYPTGPASLARKFARDLVGITGIKRLYFILLMALGFYTYTLSTNAKKIDQTGRSLTDYLRAAVTNLHGTVITNLVLFAILWWCGAPLLYLLWAGAYLTTFSLFLRIRSIAEHACTPDASSALLNTRTTLASPIARLTVAPHRVNYHLEHHLFMQVPYFNLPSLHELLLKQEIVDTAAIAPNYIEVLRLAMGKAKL